ncbi:MAG: diguanylate cyclase [Polyangia bacterium]|jgi:diguanylate cyclase (GGDEF)-like protein|nr:diguanylate cyclase [Polyangia bacterium]
MARRRILIIDRSEPFLEKTRELLRSQGFEVKECRSADEGVRAVIDWRPDLVLANAHTTDADEPGFTPRVHEVDPTLPVILLFAAETEENQGIFERSGAVNYLIRPLKDPELLGATRSGCQIRDLQLRLLSLGEERDTLARQLGGSLAEQDSRDRFYQFEFFKKIAGIELKRSKRYSFPLSLMLVSYDSAEAISGSAYSRELFSALARIIREGVRDIDIPISFSEETILVLMPHTDLLGARVVADRIRERAAMLPDTYGVVQETTVSIGLVCTESTPRLEFGALVQQVTRALREAKRRGGDTVAEV